MTICLRVPEKQPIQNIFAYITFEWKKVNKYLPGSMDNYVLEAEPTGIHTLPFSQLQYQQQIP